MAKVPQEISRESQEISNLPKIISDNSSVDPKYSTNHINPQDEEETSYEEDLTHVVSEEVTWNKSLEVIEFIELNEDELIINSDIFLHQYEDYAAYEDLESESIYDSSVSEAGTYNLMREILNNIVSDSVCLAQKSNEEIIQELGSTYKMTKEIICDIVTKLSSTQKFREIIDEIIDTSIHVEKSSTMASIQLVDILLDRCLSMNRTAKDLICDIIEGFPSSEEICGDILLDIIDNALKRAWVRERKFLLQQDEKEYQKNCLLYTEVTDAAKYIIKDIVNEGEEALRKYDNRSSDISCVEHETHIEMKPTYRWSDIQNFSIERGHEDIIRFLKTWTYQEDWLFNVKYIMAQSSGCSDFHLYEAKFGIPTKQYPIPQATVSVFFTIEVSRVLPPSCLVIVTYVFEGNRLVHKCNEHFIQEDFLFNQMMYGGFTIKEIINAVRAFFK